MICLTSDIHHMSLNTGNQQHSDRTEVDVANEFSKMLSSRGMKGTYFITGKCFEEEWYQLREICENQALEIGGHTYHCFMPELLHRVWNKVAGSYNGPRWYQNWDVAKTKRIIFRKTGKNITSWRNHMYMHGPYTESVLADNDIHICCDHVRRHEKGYTKDVNGVTNFPINIIPDHEHLYHAERTPEWVEQWIRRYNWSDDYGSKSYCFEDWFEIFKNEVLLRENSNVVSHILIHPITIYLCGGLKAMGDIVDFLAQFETVQVSEFITNSQKIQKSS